MLDTIIMAMAVVVSLASCVFVAFTSYRIKKDSKRSSIHLNPIRERIENEAINANNKLTMSMVSFADSSNLYLSGPKTEITLNNDVVNQSFLTEMGIDYENIEVVENQVMCLMSFNKRYERVYSIIREQCKKNGYNCVRSDDEYWDEGSLLKSILIMILKSQLLIAVLNGRNANVFYEVGLAHALGKKIILIAEHRFVQTKRERAENASANESVFDLQNRRIILYDNYEKLNKLLNATLSQIHKRDDECKNKK